LGANLQPIDSPKSNWIDWGSLSCVEADGTSTLVSLFDHATLASGSFSVANATWTIVEGADGILQDDELVFYYLDQIATSTVLKNETIYTFFTGGAATVHNIRVAGLDNVVTDATNDTPIVITTSSAHGLSTSDIVFVAHVTGNTAANGAWFITVLSSTTFSLSSSAGNGAYAGAGTVGLRREYSYTEVGGDSAREVAAGLDASIGSSDPYVNGENVRGNSITNATNANPIQIDMTGNHFLATGNSVLISGVGGNTAANGAFIITKVSDSSYTWMDRSGTGRTLPAVHLTRPTECSCGRKDRTALKLESPPREVPTTRSSTTRLWDRSFPR